MSITDFAVRSDNFKTYRKFRRNVQKLGWKFNFKFGFHKFREDAMEFNNCMIFSDEWPDMPESKRRFAFSNTDNSTLIFNLDTEVGYEQALKYAEK